MKKGVGLDSIDWRQGWLRLEEGAIEHPLSTHSAPFGTRWKPAGNLHSLSMCAVMFVMLFLAGVGNAWGYTGRFAEVTSMDDLTTGYYVVTPGLSASTLNKALGPTANSDKRIPGVTVSISGSTPNRYISNPGDTVVYLITKTVVSGTTYYTFYNVGKSKYLYQSSTTSGKGMAFKADSENLTCEGYNADTPKGFKFLLNGDSYNYFKWNNSSSWYSNYSSGYTSSMSPFSLFKIAYKVTYDGNGKTSGSVPTDSKYYFSGKTVTAKTNSGSLARTGYTFDGWNTKADGTGTDIATSGTFTISDNITLYAKWVSDASCEATPSLGTPTLTGITSSTISVTCPTISAGTDCSINDYGFVWKASSDPTISDNKTQKGTNDQSSSYSLGLSITVSTSTTYYIKAYAINNGDHTGLSSSLQVSPKSVTFNSNGGSSVATKYVNSGTPVSQPSAPTKTGYNFSKWQLSGSDYSFSTNVTSNITLDAVWTAKTYTVTLNDGDGSGGDGSVTVTYNSNSNLTSAVTIPTRTGYDFTGYKNSYSTLFIDANGDWIAGVSGYTDASKNWIYADDVTLNAQWTIKNYSVTWKVNNTNYTTGSPSDNVNHGSRVSKLPTDPDPEDYCGDKFIGWTTDVEYTHGTSTLFTTAGTAPVATGDQIFYAVFADYDE